MATMVRKQVYIEPEQDERLKLYARTLGVTEAELIRRGIDAVVPASGAGMGRALREVADATVYSVRASSLAERDRGWRREDLYEGRPRYLAERDLRSWERALEIMRKYTDAGSEEPVSAPERGWSREDAYAERLARMDD